MKLNLNYNKLGIGYMDNSVVYQFVQLNNISDIYQNRQWFQYFQPHHAMLILVWSCSRPLLPLTWYTYWDNITLVMEALLDLHKICHGDDKYHYSF